MIQEKLGEKIEQVYEGAWTKLENLLNFGFHLGEEGNQVNITIGLMLLLIASFFITHLLLGWIRRIFTRKMNRVDTLKFISLFKFIRYVVFVLVFFAVLSYSGINVTPFLAASAALLVGVGLALQELFQDLIGGIIIMLDKSLLVGDIIELEGRVGQITEINLRSTRALTRDDKVMIIPNHKFIREYIYNYTQNHESTRDSISVGVAYGSDTELVTSLLLKSLEKQDNVLSNPPAVVIFDDFGDSALQFRLIYYVEDSFTSPTTASQVRYKIDQLFREHGVTIPFPQRDVHIYPVDKGAATHTP